MLAAVGALKFFFIIMGRSLVQRARLLSSLSTSFPGFSPTRPYGERERERERERDRERECLSVISQILGDTWPDPTRVSPLVGERTWERSCISLSIKRCLHSEKPVRHEKTSSGCGNFKSLTLTRFRFSPPGVFRISGNSWRGCAARFSKSWTYFRPEIWHFPQPKSIPGSLPIFRPGVTVERNYVIIT